MDFPARPRGRLPTERYELNFFWFFFSKKTAAQKAAVFLYPQHKVQTKL